MTKLDQQKAAISSAVEAALQKLGLSAIADSDFFGMKPRR